MQYALYLDSLFLVNFVMNFYLLLLVDRSAFRTATPGRLLSGALVGGLGGLLPFVLPGPGLLKMVLGILVGTVGMIHITFPVKSFRMFLKLMERLILYTFCMGGAILFLIRTIPDLRSILTGIFGIIGMGGVCFMLLSRSRKKIGQRESLCRARLSCGQVNLTVAALIDSGNSLIEPISGKPVCIVEEQMLNSLIGTLPAGCRIIPYHSIGKKHGILEGYLLPELELELEGIHKTFYQVWIAAGPQGISETSEAESIKMIINPMLFAERRKGWPRRRQNERNYDTESGITG